MPRSVRSRPLTLPRLMFYVVISPFVVMGALMLGILGFSLLAFLIALITAAVGR